MVVSRRDQKLPNWKRFLSCSRNKVELVDFLLEEWKLPEYARFILSKSLFVCHGDECSEFRSMDGKVVSSAPVPELSCHQEEADTRMFFHAKHASVNGFDCVIIRSPDTDVAVIGCSLASAIPARILLHTGTKHRSQFLDLSRISQHLGASVSAALPGAHAFSGCDTTSAFSRKGKTAVFKLILGGHSDAMQLLGSEFKVSDQLYTLCEKFVCQMYGKPEMNSVNELRYQLFRSRTSHSMSLPPTKDALNLHVQRCNYQAALWRRALDPLVNGAPSPKAHGWIVDEMAGTVGVKWTTLGPAPAELMELISCKCSTHCSTQRCKCRRSNLVCSELCKCSGCQNRPPPAESEVGSDVSSEEETSAEEYDV